MKRKIRNILILGFFFTGIPYLRAKLLQRKEPLVRVLAMHHIYNPELFVASIRFLKKYFNIITPEEFVEKRFHPKKINILLTFDDGYASWHEHVLPLFKKLKIRGIFFVSDGFINAKDWQRYGRENLLLKNPKPPLTRGQVEDLREVGVIAQHTESHRRLVTLEKDEIIKEIGTPDEYNPYGFFAYPFGLSGDYNQRVLDSIISAGYKYVFTTDINFFKKDDSVYSIPRLCYDTKATKILSYAIIFGGYDWVRK